MKIQLISTLTLTLLACSTYNTRENSDDWYDWGVALDVEEPVAFTETPYGFPSDAATSIDALSSAIFPVDWWTSVYGPDDLYSDESGCQSQVNYSLPFTIEGVVTILPDYYFKTLGCDGDEKYYGSYFIQDNSGGIFILGDSKVAHFDMGDRIKLTVRGGRSSYDLNMVTAHDVVEIVEHDNEIYFQRPTGPFSIDDIATVQRVEGEVMTEPDTFGAFTLADTNGATYTIQLDSELNRRGVTFSPGHKLRATGPLIYSYSEFAVVIMRIGQLENL
jgi:hypothetical protein